MAETPIDKRILDINAVHDEIAQEEGIQNMTERQRRKWERRAFTEGTLENARREDRIARRGVLEQARSDYYQDDIKGLGDALDVRQHLHDLGVTHDPPEFENGTLLVTNVGGDVEQTVNSLQERFGDTHKVSSNGNMIGIRPHPRSQTQKTRVDLSAKKSMQGVHMKNRNGPVEPLGAQFLKRLHDDLKHQLIEYDDILNHVEDEPTKILVVKMLRSKVKQLDAIEHHWKSHPRYKALPPIDDMDDEQLDEEQEETEEEEEALEAEEEARDGLVRDGDVTAMMQTKDFTEDEAEDIKEDIDEESEDTEEDEEKEDKGEDEEEELKDEEKQAVSESADFIKSLVEPDSYWSDNHRQKSYYYHKLLDKIGGPGEAMSPLDMAEKALAGSIKPDDDNEANFHKAMSGNQDDILHVFNLDQATPEMANLVNRPEGATQDEYNNAVNTMPPGSVSTSTRKMCKDCSMYLKELSGAQALSNDHRNKALKWHKDLTEILTSKDDELGLPPDGVGGPEVQQQLREEGVVDELQEKRLKKGKALPGKSKADPRVMSLSKVLEDREASIKKLTDTLNSLTQSLNH